MASQIDARNMERRRAMGIGGALSQDRHAAVNARYPGLTTEHCWVCEQATGRAGRGEDSIYDRDDEGPYCEECREAQAKRFD